MALMQRNNGVWYADFRALGGGMLSCKTRDRDAALVEHNRLERGVLLARTVSHVDPMLPTSSATIGEAFARAIRLHYRGKKSERTVEFHRKALLRSIPESTLLSAIGIDDFERVVAEQQAKGNSLRTINRVMQTTNRVLKLAVDWKMLDKAPRLPSFDEPIGRIRVITPEEERTITDWCLANLPEMAEFIVAMIDTGLRRGEIVNRTLLVHDRKRTMVSLKDSKGKLQRSVPLTPRADEALTAWLARPALTVDQIEYRWSKLRAACGFQGDKEFVIHALRHTCCTRLIQQGMDTARVQLFMGHKDIKTTLLYTHLSVEDLRPLSHALAQATATANTPDCNVTV